MYDVGLDSQDYPYGLCIIRLGLTLHYLDSGSIDYSPLDSRLDYTHQQRYQAVLDAGAHAPSIETIRIWASPGRKMYRGAIDSDIVRMDSHKVVDQVTPRLRCVTPHSKLRGAELRTRNYRAVPAPDRGQRYVVADPGAAVHLDGAVDDAPDRAGDSDLGRRDQVAGGLVALAVDHERRVVAQRASV